MPDIKKAEVVQVIRTISNTDNLAVKLVQFWTPEGLIIGSHEIEDPEGQA